MKKVGLLGKKWRFCVTLCTSHDKVQPTYQGSIAEEDVWLEAH